MEALWKKYDTFSMKSKVYVLLLFFIADALMWIVFVNALKWVQD